MGNQQGQELCREEEDIVRQGQRDVRPGIRPLLEEGGGRASRVAAAMAFSFVRCGRAASGLHIILHAEYAVRVMVMGDDRHAQHQYAEK